MALQKQNVQLNFGQGLETKVDPWQVPLGKMLNLQNSIFNKGGMLQKRNGYLELTSLPNSTTTTLTTYNGSLVALGNELDALSQDTGQWYNKGVIEPIQISTIPLVRTTYSQQTIDTAIAPNGLCCGVYTDSLAGNTYYQINDSETGQIIASYTLITGARMPRVFALGNDFMITYLITVSAATHFKILPISSLNPLNPLSTIDVSSQVKNLTAGYDGYVKNNNLYVAFNASDVGGAIRVYYIDSTLVVHSPHVITQTQISGDLISVTADVNMSINTVWVSYYNFTLTEGKTIAFDTNLNVLLTLTPFLSTMEANVTLLTSTSVNNILTIFYTDDQSMALGYTYANILKKTVTIGGVVSSPFTVILGAAPFSKSFYISDNNIIYLVVSFNGPLQPTYFLIDQNGNTLAKFAYSNGAGYPINQILSSVHVSSNTAELGYLFRATLTPVNKTQGAAQASGISSQTGGNLITLTFNEFPMVTEEIASALHISSGFTWMYDGAKPVEHSFDLWPEPFVITGGAVTGGGLSPQQYFYQMTYEWTDAQGNLHRSAPSVPQGIDLSHFSGTPVIFHSVFLTGANRITPSSFTGLHVGQVLTDNTTPGNLAAGTFIQDISGGTIGLSQPTLGPSAASPGDALQTVDTLEVNLNLPTLTFTAKIGTNPIRLVLYRWSTGQQVYYQTTFIAAPVLNDTTAPLVSYADKNNDAEIIGNVVIYTTGGVVENIASPSSQIMALYKSRIMLLDAEDPNLVWYSKQVIEDTPVEFSDLFTIFIAPTLSAQGSTGPVKAMSAMDDKFILFKKDAIYYITGNGPDNTGANNDFSDPTFITSVVGCSNQQSIVFIPNGLMFQSDKGIWLLGRDLSTSYIGAPVEAYNTAIVQSAVNVPGTNQVRFTLNTGITLMYDYFYDQWGTFTNVPAVSSTIYQSLHTFVNSFGQVFQESVGSYLDGTQPVLMSFVTAWCKLAGLQGFERAYFFYLLGNYLTPHKLQIQIAYDYNPFFEQSSMINPINFNENYGEDPLYGSGSPYGGNTTVEQWRIFLQKQKCESFQIKLSEIYDPSFNVQAGAGLTLSGLNLIVGVKLGYPKLKPSLSVG